jgi:NodT family efflux transporter outer membrane factor (OMF) lipoprotein
MLQIMLLCTLAADPAAWWKSYGDPVLSELVERALKTNLDLRQARARVAEARALTGEARSALLPSLGWNGGAQQLRGGFQQGIVRVPQSGSGGAASFVTPFETGLLSASLDTRWEISFWGSNSKRVSAARADVQAAEDEALYAQIVVSAEVARTYFEMRGLERQLDAVRRNRARQADLLELTKLRAAAGLGTELDVERQAAALASLEAGIPMLESERTVRLNRLGVLVADRSFAAQPLPAAPLEVRLPRLEGGIDSGLLLRRPDVRAAEARIQAATARLKAARSESYPRVLLTGLMGRQGTSVSGLSLGGGNFFGVGPQLVLPIFTGGRIRANIQANDARLEQASVAYERELLAAFQETEDAIAGYRAELERTAKLQQAKASASSALSMAENLYVGGAGDFLAVLEAQRAVLEMEQEMAAAEAAAAVRSVLLFKAVAGGLSP